VLGLTRLQSHLTTGRLHTTARPSVDTLPVFVIDNSAQTHRIEPVDFPVRNKTRLGRWPDPLPLNRTMSTRLQRSACLAIASTFDSRCHRDSWCSWFASYLVSPRSFV